MLFRRFWSIMVLTDMGFERGPLIHTRYNTLRRAESAPVPRDDETKHSMTKEYAAFLKYVRVYKILFSITKQGSQTKDPMDKSSHAIFCRVDKRSHTTSPG